VVGVRAIRYIADPIAIHTHGPAMAKRDRQDLDIADMERLVIDHGDVYTWDRSTGAGHLAEGIGERAFEDVDRFGHGIDRQRTSGAEVVGSDVVKTADVVEMVMREDHGINVHHVVAKHLLAKIRRGVDHHRGGVGSDQHRRAQPLIPRIGTRAGGTLTRNAGDAGGCSCAEQGKAHQTWRSAWYELRTSGPDSTTLKPMSNPVTS